MSFVLTPQERMIPPNDPAISYTDIFNVNLTASRAKFTRPIVDGSGFENCSPTGRIRFRTDSPTVQFLLYYSNLVTRPDTYNDISHIFVDGVSVGTFTSPGRIAAQKNQTLNFGSRVMRTIELYLPYCASVEFQGIVLERGHYLLPCVPRPVKSLGGLGDSITHGFNATDSSSSWVTLLAKTRGWELFNLGYGGRITFSDDGAIIGAKGTEVVTVLLGHNDFRAQLPLVPYRATFKQLLQNIRAQNAGTRIVVITPLWTGISLPIGIESYRQMQREAVGEVADGNTQLIEGTVLAPGNSTYFPDLVHPGVGTGAIIGANLAALITGV